MKTSIIRFSSLLMLTGWALCMGCNFKLLASPLDNWTSRSSGTASQLLGVVFGAEQFVAVGENGTILTSSNGATWTVQNSGFRDSLNAAAYGNGVFVAVGAPGTVLRSTNSINWETRSSGSTATLNSVTYGNGLFVATGAGGTILTSVDGNSWTVATSGVVASLTSVRHVNNIFLAVGEGGVVLVSIDGVVWGLRNSGTSDDLVGAAWGKGVFMTGTGDVSYGGDCIHTSADTTDWTARVITTNVWQIYDVAFRSGYFVAVGNTFYFSPMPSVAEPAVFFSPDGVGWTARNVVGEQWLQFNAIASGAGTFVVVGEYGAIFQSDAIPDVTAPPLLSINLLSTGVVRLDVTNPASLPLVLQTSTNLLTSAWQSIATNSFGTNQCQLFHTSSPPALIRFYRTMLIGP